MKNNKAFTLAEVLITLTIIGIIAAITIPNLMQKWQKEATVTKVKKGYNAITRMATNIKTNSNCDDLECTGLINDFSLEKFVELAGLKDAKIKQENNWRRIMYMYCEKQACNDNEGDAFSRYIITQDGMGYIVSIATRGADNRKMLQVTLLTDVKPTNRGDTYYKKGRNTFYFLITDDLHAEPRVSGFGSSTWTLSEASKKVHYYINPSFIESNCNVNTSRVNSGDTCAAKILLDGWKMNY